MSCRPLVLVLGLLLATSAMASDGLPLANRCRAARQAVPVDVMVRQLATSPEHASLLADAGDGRLAAVRRKLDVMPRQEAARWRQSAMMFAVQAGQPDVVEAMLDDGADVNAMALLPGYKHGFLDRMLGQAIRKSLAKNGMLSDHGSSIGPALPIAVSCGDLATVDALLRHHANVMAREAPDISDALTAAIMRGDSVMTQRLLDHGADVCADDHRMRQRQGGSSRHFHTLAELGQRAGLSANLTARLACPLVTATR